MPWKNFLKRWTEALLSPPEQMEVRSFGREPETRRSPRAAVRFWTLFLGGPHYGALTVELSLEGCRVEGDFRDLVGKEARLCLELSDAPEPLMLKGRFVWADGEHAGIQFLNLHVFDEVRLLRTLGQVSSVPPSTYLPASPSLGTDYEYTLTSVDEEHYRLEIVAPNWNFLIAFKSTTVIGPPRGKFHHFQLQDSSLPLQRLRARQRICLEKPKLYRHLFLINSAGETVLDLLGEEVGFERYPRFQRPHTEAV